MGHPSRLASLAPQDDAIRSIPPEQADQLALDAHAVGRKDANLVGGISRLERDRGTAAPEALEGGLLIVDQRDDDIAGIGGVGAFDQRDVAIEVIKLPESVAHGMAAARTRGFTPSVIEGNLGRVRTSSEDESGRPVAVPVMGRIAAGTPIEAIQTRSHTINMPSDLLSTGEHFALEVRGDSMIEAGILDGDIALLKRSDAADTGDIVVALIDDEEATLKRFRRRGASIALEPANTAYEVRILPPNRVRIQGKLVGLFRRY